MFRSDINVGKREIKKIVFFNKLNKIGNNFRAKHILLFIYFKSFGSFSWPLQNRSKTLIREKKCMNEKKL